MAVVHFSTDDQSSHLAAHNQTVSKAQNKIPLVPRNFESGWPLLQVSLFYPIVTSDCIKYTQVLGGGKCHYFYVGAFNFANLLTSIPGNIKVQDSHRRDPTPEKFKIDFVERFLEGFSFEHSKLHIEVRMKGSGGYGKALVVKVPDDPHNLLQTALDEPLHYALVDKSPLGKSIGWGNRAAAFKTALDEGRTADYIREQVKTNAAVFSHGQIFLDLGHLLDQTNNPEVKEYLEAIFQVQQFNDLKQANPAFKPQKTAADELLEEERIIRDYRINNNPVIKACYQAIDDLSAYGKSNCAWNTNSAKLLAQADQFKKEVDALAVQALKSNINEQELQQQLETLQTQIREETQAVRTKASDFFKNIHPQIKLLYEQINAMADYGKTLEKIDKPKGEIASTLADQLNDKLTLFLSTHESPTPEEESKFRTEFKELLHSKDEEMSTHRARWKPIVANIALALTGIGTLALIIQLAYSKYKTGKFLLFWDKTKRQGLVDAMDEPLEKAHLLGNQ